MKIICMLIFLCLGKLSFAQFQTQRPILIAQKVIEHQEKAINGMEIIKVILSQPPLLHNDGGWEKGPSLWATSTKFPIEYRGGYCCLIVLVWFII